MTKKGWQDCLGWSGRLILEYEENWQIFENPSLSWLPLFDLSGLAYVS